MFNGAHLLLYSSDPDADRAFIKDVLKFPSVDAGRGWLIFALPPAELAVHPVDAGSGQSHSEHNMLGSVLYLMCEDLNATLASLHAQGVETTEVSTERWGIKTSFRLPSGGELGLYQPTHPVAIGLK